jgi:hypothetical protein
MTLSKYLHRDDYATRLIRLLSIRLRLLTLTELALHQHGAAAQGAGVDGQYV